MWSYPLYLENREVFLTGADSEKYRNENQEEIKNKWKLKKQRHVNETDIEYFGGKICREMGLWLKGNIE